MDLHGWFDDFFLDDSMFRFSSRCFLFWFHFFWKKSSFSHLGMIVWTCFMVNSTFLACHFHHISVAVLLWLHGGCIPVLAIAVGIIIWFYWHLCPKHQTSNKKRPWKILTKSQKNLCVFGNLWWSWFWTSLMNSNSAACLYYLVIFSVNLNKRDQGHPKSDNLKQLILTATHLYIARVYLIYNWVISFGYISGMLSEIFNMNVYTYRHTDIQTYRHTDIHSTFHMPHSTFHIPHSIPFPYITLRYSTSHYIALHFITIR